MFPLLFLTNNHNIFDITSLGLLRQQNGFIILQSLFAMIMLVRKCISLMKDLDPQYIAQSHWKHTKYVLNINKYKPMKPWIKYDIHRQRSRKNSNTSSTSSNSTHTLHFDTDEMYRLIVARFETNDTTISKLKSFTNSNNVNSSLNNHNINITKVTKANNIHMEEMSDEDNKESQCKRKSIVIACGLLFILDGLLILIFFLVFIHNDFYNKCINIDSYNNGTIKSEWLLKHPELQFYNKYCDEKVVNMFDEYPCNCRLFRAEFFNPKEFTPKIFETSVKMYDNLEGILLNSDGATNDLSSNFSYYFSSTMFDNLVS